MTRILLTAYALLISSLFASAQATKQEGTLREITFTVRDSRDGNPFPSRVHLMDAAGNSVNPGGFPYHRTHFTIPGTATVKVKPGSYTYEIEHGPQYSLARGFIEVHEVASKPVLVETSLKRLFDITTEGWWSGDLHVHRPVEDIELLMRTEELHVAPVITWWNKKNLWAGRPLPGNALVRFDENYFYHVMAGEDEREGGALLFFDLEEPLAITEATREFPSPMKFLTMARKRPGSWIDIEKPFWWDVPIWIASGEVDSIGIANNHMTRDGIYSPSKRNTRPNWSEEAWGKPRNYEQLPSPLGNGYWSQEIYYHILNSGIRIPPSAGSASGVLPNQLGYNRVWVQVDGDLTYGKWWSALRAGRCFVSNGPLLRCKANGEWPGAILEAGDGDSFTIELEGALDSRDPISAIEIIVNGKVHKTVPFEDLQESGKLGTLDFDESGWFLVRAIADVPHTFRFASTAPWYVEIGDHKRRISRSSAEFFLNWVGERRDRVAHDVPGEKAEVLRHHDAAEGFWIDRVESATVD